MRDTSSLGIALLVVGVTLVLAGIVVLMLRDPVRRRRPQAPPLPRPLPPPRRAAPPIVVTGSAWPTTSGEAERIESPVSTPVAPIPSEPAVSADAAADPGIRLRLTVTGPSDARHAVRVLTLRGRHVAGRRAPDDALRFPDDACMSARHCEMSVERDAVMLRDLDSANGTIVNGVPVRAGQRYRLGDGDVIRMGETELRVTFLEREPAPDASPAQRDPVSRDAR